MLTFDLPPKVFGDEVLVGDVPDGLQGRAAGERLAVSKWQTVIVLHSMFEC